jgi:hypothetical protein
VDCSCRRMLTQYTWGLCLHMRLSLSQKFMPTKHNTMDHYGRFMLKQGNLWQYNFLCWSFAIFALK